MKKKFPLASKIMLGMIVGIVLGIFLGSFREYLPHDFLFINFFKIGGKIFLNLFRMIVIPVVMVSMILGVTTMNNPALLGRVGLKTVIIFALTTMLSSVLGLGTSIFCGLGKNSAIDLPKPTDGQQVSEQSLSQIISDIVPENMFESVVEGDMMQIIFVAVMIGLAINFCGDKANGVKNILKEIDYINTRIIELTLMVAPYGVCCLMLETFYNFGPKAGLPLLSYVICVVLVMAFVMFVVYSLILKCYCHVSPWKFYRKYWSVMVFAFSSSSSNATLPLNIHTLTEKLGTENGISTFILSLGATINMNGTAIMQSCATVFIANLYGIDLTITKLAQVVLIGLISAIGTAGMPSAGVLMLGLVLESVGIPLEGTAIIMGVDRIVDMFRTTVNVTGDAITTMVVSKSENKITKELFY